MPSGNAARIFVVGANHRSSTALLRDRLFVDEAMMPPVFDRLRGAGLSQALILSTCDRTEIQGVHSAPERAAARIREDFAAMGNVGRDEIVEQSYTLFDDAALRHMFAVASSLDSQVVGEPQVLGQVKAGHRIAADCGMVGFELEAVLQAAYGVAKRVRNETDIARRPVSIASAAAQVAQDLHGDLSHCQALLVGLGEIGDLIHEQLRTAGLRRITLTGPALRTEIQARRAGMHFSPFENLKQALAAADIVVAAVGTGRIIVDREAVEHALRQRRRRPVLLLDGGVPADIDPAVEHCDGAFLYSLDDLERVVMEGRARRLEAAEPAWRIVDDAVASWRRDQSERAAVPALVALRGQFEAAREQVLRDAPNADAGRVTQLLINRLLHRPTSRLRDLAARKDHIGTEEAEDSEDLIRRLFGDGTDDEGA
jgi:glutamyl-tRNA reductase